MVDFLSGVHLYGAVMTALYDRTRTGRRRLVEVAMQEVVYPTLASNLTFMYDQSGVPPRTGNRHSGLSFAPYNVYPTSDGFIAIINTNERHWVQLLNAMGCEDLIGNEQFSSTRARVRSIDEVDAKITAWTSRHTKSDASRILREFKVPSAPVRDLVEVMNDPHMHERGMLQWRDHPEFGRIVAPDSPLRFHGATPIPWQPSPHLGEHNGEILRDVLGLCDDEIATLRSEQVVGPRLEA